MKNMPVKKLKNQNMPILKLLNKSERINDEQSY
jgi:hypothetical protein